MAGPRTPAERREEARREKLEQIKEQVDDGRLVIRRMTKQERRRYPPAPHRPDKRKA